jgi:hypothetical protein
VHRPDGARVSRETRTALAALLAAAALACCPTAAADLADEAALAEAYAPVVRLVEQAEECGPGEPYLPVDVEVLFDEPTVGLRGPWGDDLVEVGPSAADLSRGLFEYHLDFPGNALDPGCGYEQWARRISEGTSPTVYAHVATDPGYPGQLSLQYWLFYVYNDWNNLHEGDWEMVQLVFEAPDAREALSRDPTSIGYSQHQGAERAEWGEDKLELVDSRHPIVHPAAGSHANFYEEALFLGSSGEQGVGCDDTSGPTYDIRPVVQTIPSDPDAAHAAFPWIAFEGRWGEFQRSPFNGPRGPNLTSRWTEPIEWSQGWRDKSFAVPGGGALGTGSTDFFCGAVAAGSEALRQLLDEPVLFLAALAALVALALFGVSRATWRPTAPLRVGRRRAWGQILAAAGRMYVSRLGLFGGIGLLFLPISVVITILQATLLQASRVVGIETEGESQGFLVLLVVALGTTLTLFGLALVQAATACALVRIDAGESIGPVEAYRRALSRIRSLLGAIAIAVAVWTALSVTAFLIPVAIWLAIRWALLAPVVELEGQSAAGALGGSSRLVRGRWLRVASLVGAGSVLVLVAGPLLGALLIFVTDAPLALLNLVAGVVYALAMPFVALTTSYVYFDARTRTELEPADEPDELPAEIELS